MPRLYSAVALITSLAATLAPAQQNDSEIKAPALAVVNAIANGDKDALNANFSGTENDKRLAIAMMELLQASNTFREACNQQFGAAATKGELVDPKKMTDQVNQARVDVTGEKAELVYRDGRNPHDGMQLKLVQGTWKVSAVTGNADTRVKLLTFLPPVTTALKDAAAEVKAGKYERPAEAQAAVQEKVLGIMKQKGLVPTSKPAH